MTKLLSVLVWLGIVTSAFAQEGNKQIGNTGREYFEARVRAITEKKILILSSTLAGWVSGVMAILSH